MCLNRNVLLRVLLICFTCCFGVSSAAESPKISFSSEISNANVGSLVNEIAGGDDICWSVIFEFHLGYTFDPKQKGVIANIYHEFDANKAYKYMDSKRSSHGSFKLSNGEVLSFCSFDASHNRHAWLAFRWQKDGSLKEIYFNRSYKINDSIVNWAPIDYQVGGTVKIFSRETQRVDSEEIWPDNEAFIIKYAKPAALLNTMTMKVIRREEDQKMASDYGIQITYDGNKLDQFPLSGKEAYQLTNTGYSVKLNGVLTSKESDDAIKSLKILIDNFEEIDIADPAGNRISDGLASYGDLVHTRNHGSTLKLREAARVVLRKIDFHKLTGDVVMSRGLTSIEKMKAFIDHPDFKRF